MLAQFVSPGIIPPQHGNEHISFVDTSSSMNWVTSEGITVGKGVVVAGATVLVVEGSVKVAVSVGANDVKADSVFDTGVIFAGEAQLAKTNIKSMMR